MTGSKDSNLRATPTAWHAFKLQSEERGKPGPGLSPTGPQPPRGRSKPAPPRERRRRPVSEHLTRVCPERSRRLCVPAAVQPFTPRRPPPLPSQASACPPHPRPVPASPSTLEPPTPAPSGPACPSGLPLFPPRTPPCSTPPPAPVRPPRARRRRAAVASPAPPAPAGPPPTLLQAGGVRRVVRRPVPRDPARGKCAALSRLHYHRN